MSILNLFKKPNWKHKDDAIRAAAVASEKSPELMNQLPNIAQNDPSEKVKSAALRRLDDYALILSIANSNTQKSVKANANKMLQDWLKNTDSEQQLTIVMQITDAKTLENAAANAKNKDIRTYCIENIKKQGLLADLLTQEKDRNLRQLILYKINKPATLKRLLKTFKNKDKTLLKSIQSKLEHDGDAKKIAHKKATDLCEQMEKLIHNPNSSSQSDVDAIFAKWQELNQSHDLNALKQRFEGAYRTASLTFDPKQRDEFLAQQRSQKIDGKIKELQIALTIEKWDTWEKIQSQISKYSGFDLSHANAEQKQAFDKALIELKALRDSKSKEQELPDELLQVADKLDAALKHKYNQPNQISQFRKMWDDNAKNAKNNAAFSTLKNRFDNAMLKLAERIENTAALREEAAKNAVAAIPKVSQLIEEGHLADAKIAINKIAENKKIAGFHPLIKQHKFEFDALWNELKELRKWQTWSNDKIRIRLIDELKDLVGKGIHPDALLKKMKEANVQWKDMEDHEKLAGDRFGVRNQELYTQFRAVQEALFTPAKEFFEKRSEIWDNELQQVEDKIQALHDVDLQQTSDRDLARMVRDAIKQLRNLDNIPPKARGKCAARIRSGTARIDAHLKESYKVAERRKQKLIDHAQQLIEHEHLDEAIEQAKALQQDWKNAGIVHQSTERKLWKKFRKANDAVFNRIKQHREQVNQENKELMDQASTLIKQTEKRIKSEKDSHSIHSLIEKFKDDWHAMSIHNKGLQAKAHKLIETGEQKVASLANTETIKTLKNAEKYANLCQQCELGKIDKQSAQEKWDNLPIINDSKLQKSLNKRFENVEKTNENYAHDANNILIAAEYLTGSATPDEYKEQRLEFQVNQLSRRMSGEDITPEAEKAQQLLTQWFTLGGTDKDFIHANDKRIKKITKNLYELLS